MHRPLVLVALLTAVVALPLSAQRHTEGFQPWAAPAHALEADETPASPSIAWGRVPRRDYRYEGLLIGGLAFGTLGTVIGSGLSLGCPTVPGADCRDPDRLGNAVTLGLVGAAIGGGLGYLVGWLSPKRDVPAAADSTAF